MSTVAQDLQLPVDAQNSLSSDIAIALNVLLPLHAALTQLNSVPNPVVQSWAIQLEQYTPDRVARVLVCVRTCLNRMQGSPFWVDHTLWGDDAKNDVHNFAMTSMDALEHWFFWTWKVRSPFLPVHAPVPE